MLLQRSGHQWPHPAGAAQVPAKMPGLVTTPVFARSQGFRATVSLIGLWLSAGGQPGGRAGRWS